MITEGILNINKPQNMTSHDVVGRLRRILSMKKIGHTGTLDPMATGVLPICIGKSTRIMEYLDMDLKKYRCKMLLGVQTDTQDIWGEVISQCKVDVNADDVKKAFEPFKGVIDQKPPMYSALKVDGKRLYEYAREGKTVDVKTRKIYINSLELEDIDIDGEEKTVTFTVECSKGTYIRTICQDAGNALGCYGTLASLERTASGIFDIEGAIELDALSEMSPEEIEKLVIPTFVPLEAFGKVVVDKVCAIRFSTGWHIPLSECRIERKPRYEEEDFYLPIRDEFRKAYNVFGEIDGEEVFLGVAFYSDQYKKLVADKVFYVR